MPTRVPKTFKIEKRHKLLLNTRPYREGPGELICMLLDKFFDGQLAGAREEFIKILEKKRENKNGRFNKGGTVSNSLPSVQRAQSNP